MEFANGLIEDAAKCRAHRDFDGRGCFGGKWRPDVSRRADRAVVTVQSRRIGDARGVSTESQAGLGVVLFRRDLDCAGGTKRGILCSGGNGTACAEVYAHYAEY